MRKPYYRVLLLPIAYWIAHWYCIRDGPLMARCAFLYWMALTKALLEGAVELRAEKRYLQQESSDCRQHLALHQAESQ